MLLGMDISLWLLPALLVVIALAAPRYGVDSRDGYDWNRRFGPPDPPPPMSSRRRSTPAADLAALVRYLRRTFARRRTATAEAMERVAGSRG
jgi:hypothetical protein